MAKRILLVEDSPTDLAITKKLLDDSGFETFSAMTIKEGFKKAKDVSPDMILLDLMLPDGTGFELCKRIRSESASTRKILIVILSMKSSKEDIEKAFESGADDYIVKPPAPEFLLKKIKLYMHD